MRHARYCASLNGPGLLAKEETETYSWPGFSWRMQRSRAWRGRRRMTVDCAEERLSSQSVATRTLDVERCVAAAGGRRRERSEAEAAGVGGWRGWPPTLRAAWAAGRAAHGRAWRGELIQPPPCPGATPGTGRRGAWAYQSIMSPWPRVCRTRTCAFDAAINQYERLD